MDSSPAVDSPPWDHPLLWTHPLGIIPWCGQAELHELKNAMQTLQLEVRAANRRRRGGWLGWCSPDAVDDDDDMSRQLIMQNKGTVSQRKKFNLEIS